MELMLKNKRAIVCAASKGLGYACAQSLLSEGAEVVIVARTLAALETAAEQLKKETGKKPFVLSADLTKAADRENTMTRAKELMGGVDILIANAGGPPAGPFLSHGPENWQLAIDLAVGMVTHLSALIIPSMIEQKFGRITQIVSIAGLEAIDGLILSNVSRPAVLGFAKALAREVAQHNILVNSICPGVFLTDRIKDFAEERAKTRNISTDDFMKEFAGDIPLGRPGRPGEVGDLAAFLSSPRNTYITGAAVPIDGGKTRRLY